MLRLPLCVFMLIGVCQIFTGVPVASALSLIGFAGLGLMASIVSGVK